MADGLMDDGDEFMMKTNAEKCVQYLKHVLSVFTTHPAKPKPTILSLEGIRGTKNEYDAKTGCFCNELVGELTICFGRVGCTAMTQNIPISSKYLKLINTRIKVLGPEDFKNLDFLVELQIEENFDLAHILNGTFSNLSNLVNLSISYNGQLKTIETGAFRGLSKLENLFLNNNGFESVYEITRGLSPQAVPHLVTLVMDSNDFQAIAEAEFLAMENSRVEELSLSLCRIEYIHPLALKPLKNLRRLHLGENSINDSVLSKMLDNTLEENINLQTLDFCNMGFKKEPPRPLMAAIAKSNISQLRLAKNQFEILDKNSFPFLPNLMFLELRDVLTLQITDDAFRNLPNMKTLLLGGNKLTDIPRAVLSLKNLTVLDMQVEFSNMSSLLRINLAFNGLAHLFDNSFKDLPFLQELILRNSSVYHIQKMTFACLTELRVLNLMNNIIAADHAIPDVFFSLSKLKKLVLTGCKFQFINKEGMNPFRNLKSLEYLALDKNSLITLAPTDFPTLVSLTIIDLSYNLLKSWDKRLFESNRNLSKISLAKNKLNDITLAMYQDFAGVEFIDLEQNAVLCTCSATYESFRQFYELPENFNNLLLNRSLFLLQTCGYPDDLYNVTIGDFLTKKEYGQHICNFRLRRIYFLLPLICPLVLVGLVGILAFWYRWHIRYWIFLAKLYLSRKGKIKHGRPVKSSDNFEFDAFVSYSTEDRDFVIKLVRMLENLQPFLKLCVLSNRTIISESVLESVTKSRKTVLVITDSYAKSQWCRWESQICEHHRLFFENEQGEYVDDSLLLIKLSSVAESHLTPTLKYLLKTRIYLEWTLDERKQQQFWNKLRSTLRPPTTIVENIHPGN
ncbi:hypothetical protein HUJ05_010031 [Dendroctonus ponderosae]|nr:hypothetical protein HUJ05_010031 [Dendroctonus ponderosae]